MDDALDLMTDDPSFKACPDCKTKCKANAKFCKSCGHTFPASEAAGPASAGSNSAKMPEKYELEVADDSDMNDGGEYVAPPSVFATGLPDWSLEPTETIQRKKK
jgi:hypothetical protein